MLRRRGFVVVIDPYRVEPETAAANLLSRLFAGLSAHTDFSLAGLQFLAPCVTGERLSALAREVPIRGIVSLGSFANLTDDHPWAAALGEDLSACAVEKDVPLLGICFTHQLVAHHVGCRVGYLADRQQVPLGKHTGVRTTRLLHPKLRLLLACLEDGDCLSANAIDLAYRETLDLTRAWDDAAWRRFERTRDAHLTPPEARLRHFLRTATPDSYQASVRHEQEVLSLSLQESGISATPRPPYRLVRAGSSPACTFDALVGDGTPLYTFQAHPETPHESGDGRRLLRNFLYLCHLHSLAETR